MSTLADQLAGLNGFVPPFSNDAERGGLSCIIQDPEERLSEARLELLPEAFYHAQNRTVYEALLAMADRAVTINPMSLTHELRAMKALDKVGGPGAISELFAFVPIPAHWPWFLGTIKSKWLDRQTLAALVQGIETVRDREQNGTSAEAALNSAQECLFNVKVSAQDGDGGKEYDEVLDEVIVGIMDQLDHVAIIPADRVPFGFVSLDRRMWGAVRGQFIVLAARPSMGKSALAGNIAGNVSRGTGDYVEWYGDDWPHRVGKRVIYFELEMTNKQSGTRDLVGGAGLDLQAMRYGLPLRDAHDKLGRRAREIKGSNMRKYDRPGMSLQKMRAICRRQNRKKKIDLIVIDYLQLMTSDSKRAKENRQLEIAEISAGLKEMAKELDCIVLALAQLSRSVEERKDKKPMLSDLRESGSIEQDADAVMFLMRPWYYDNDHQPKDQAFLILAKGRDVGIGEMELRFEDHFTRFTSLGMDGDRHLLSNDEEKRDGGYESKPQACKQEKAPEVKLDNTKTVSKGGGRMKWNGNDWVPPGHPSLKGPATAAGDENEALNI